VPLLLALETATRVASAALLRGEEVVAEAVAADGLTAAESVLPSVDSVLRRAGARVSEIDAFALSIGPGSFTGLRVGLATVKGLAFGSDRPVVPVSTLAALAMAAGTGDSPVGALLDASRGELYAGVFDLRGELPEAIVAEGVYTPSELIPRLPARCRLVGAGIAVCQRELEAALGCESSGAAHGPSACSVGLLGARLLVRGEFTAAAAVVPRYLRRAEAEVRRTGQRFESAGSR
jgi:tRNA threonylcarbamoyladenosine biosynthesis protein TsaB